MSPYIPALILGVAFGFSLNKAGLTKYSKIVNVYRFTDMAVLQFMLTALVISATGLYTLRGLGVIEFPNVPSTYIVGNIVGGLIFGFGMALTGFCPGTCVAGGGEGKLDYLIPGLLGFLTGAVIYGLIYADIMPELTKLANLGKIVIPDEWNLSPALLLILFAMVTGLLFYAIDRAHFHRKNRL